MIDSWEKAMSAEESRKAMKNDSDLLWEEPSDDGPEDETPVVDASLDAMPDKVSIQEELRRVDKLYGEALGYAHGFIDDVRNGKPFDFNEATPLVNEFIDSVFRNESAAAAISKLKAFDEYTYTHCIKIGRAHV